MPLVVSVTVTSVNTTVIGGEQLGWNVAVTVVALTTARRRGLPAAR